MMNRQREGINDRQASLIGQRLAPQRLLLLDLLHQGEHLDADELYRRARDKEPRLSMSTVYRNLQLFKKVGLVEGHHFNKGHSCYEVKTKAEHHHLIFLGCDRVVDFECQLSQEIKENFEARNGFHITGTKVLLVGYCADCLKQKENKV